ncbi:MAG TPA: VWA domain-containing protein [Vicinamibacterales bacterium]
MNRFVLPVLLVAVVAGSLALNAQQPVFRGGSELVRVFVTVTDRSGKLVTSLAQNDFEVRDEGKPQPITQFDNTPQPVRLVVMLDVSGSMSGNLPLLRDAGAQLFARLGKDDVARVGSFGYDVTISPTFTNDVGELRRELPSSIAPDAPTPLWRGIDQALDTFKSSEGDNKADKRPVILVLSDGKDSGPISFRQRPISQAEIIERARREDVMVFAVGMRSRSARPTSPGLGPGGLQAMLMADLPDPGLARVAEETGGGYTEIRFGQDLAAAFTEVADELHSQYLLGFAPNKRDGKVHDLAVRVNQSGFKSRARKTYLAPKS